MSDHKLLYKSSGGASDAAETTERRRRLLLDAQKSQRQLVSDARRQRAQQILDDLLQTDCDIDIDSAASSDHQPTPTPPPPSQTHHHQHHHQKHHRNRSHRKTAAARFKNHLQLSEWMRERPADLDSWFMVACPVGRRCLVVAHAGRTCVYGKNGCFVRRFRSALPGDRDAHHHRDAITILDCVQSASDGLWVLDVLAYGRHDFTDCDVAFRFFWLAGQVAEGVFAGSNAVDCSAPDDENRMRAAVRVDCADAEAVREMWSRYPLYGDGQPEVDGLLFYHKESVYVHGSTPLVGWLFPFMVAEVMGGEWADAENERWRELRPEGYVDAVGYMERFDAELRAKRTGRRRGHRGRRAMDVDAAEGEGNGDGDGEDEECVEMETVRRLEETGECVDDVHFNVND